VNAEAVEGLLSRLLLDEVDDEGLDARVERFDHAGIMTRDRGLVLRFSNGAEFQITIVQSDFPLEEDEA
jgi:hypothetical protein